MQIMVTAATQMEINPCMEALQNNPIDSHEIRFQPIGVGMLEASFHIQKIISEQKPDLILLAGIAGSFDKKKTLGEVFIVQSDQYVNAGVEENGIWKDIFDLGFSDKNQFPYTNGALVNPHIHNWNTINLPLAKSITVDEISTSENRIDAYIEKYQPLTESMEGAAFHYDCLQYSIPFLQIRSISNYVGDRNKSNWDFKNSIGNLNKSLYNLLQNL